MSAVVNSWIAYCELNLRKTPLLDFIAPPAEALMASGKLNALYQHRRGTGCPSKTSRKKYPISDDIESESSDSDFDTNIQRINYKENIQSKNHEIKLKMNPLPHSSQATAATSIKTTPDKICNGKDNRHKKCI
ncbi:hypothetical protein TNCT_177911 [Trichonephila clavata]|uniref:Uncharacterized protein n=1 Tax=Trichonephila clavata TaxID=2740835 RepID=A0A8X6LFZ5_TRICU|nr:hypothetical protein TNCT_177911 [Trichonephila clavata]